MTLEERTILEAQVRESFGRVVWTHKTQEKCADILIRKHNNIKVIQIVLSALTTTGVLIAVFGDNETIGVITAALSALLFALNTYVKGHDYTEIAQKHSDAAAEMWLVREKYFSLITDLKADVESVEATRKRRDDLMLELASVYEGAPRTTDTAYKKATEALKIKEELTFSDEEIDNFLPLELRKGLKANRPT